MMHEQPSMNQVINYLIMWFIYTSNILLDQLQWNMENKTKKQCEIKATSKYTEKRQAEICIDLARTAVFMISDYLVNCPAGREAHLLQTKTDIWC